MDTSKEYITMCEKAEEIQKESPFMVGYFGTTVLWDSGDKVILGQYKKGSFKVDAKYNIAVEGWWKGGVQHIWLPRQDQLQEMVEKRDSIDGLLQDFYFWEHATDTLTGDSFEQLWLAFVMKEKYGKTWNGKEWEIGSFRESKNSESVEIKEQFTLIEVLCKPVSTLIFRCGTTTFFRVF